MATAKQYSRKEIHIDTSQLDTLTKELKGFEKEVAVATYHALNRTIDRVITQTTKLIRQHYAIKDKVKDIKGTFRGGIKRPTKTDLTASLTSRGYTLSFAHFPFTPKKRLKKQKPVKVQIIKTKSPITSKRGFVAHTGAKSADKIQYNVFKRLGKERKPIAPIRTLSIPQMISSEKISEEIQDFATKEFNKRLEHEITREILNIGKNVKRRAIL